MSNYKGQQFSPMARQEGYEKDIIISQLKSEIWDLKQNELEFSDVIAHNKSLENQFIQLKDEKFRIENELKTKGLEQTKNLSSYRHRIDALEQQLTERKFEIQELLAQNSAQKEHCDHKQLELSRLKTENLHLEDTISRLQSESLSLKNEVDSLKEFKRGLIKDMDLLISSNDTYQQRIGDQEKLLRQADYEKAQQDRYIDSLKSQILEVENELHNKSLTIKDIQSEVLQTRQENHSLGREYEELEKSREKIRQENFHNQQLLKEEISKNFELNSSLLNLESNLRAKNNFVEELKHQLDEVKRDVLETLEQNDLLTNELDRARKNFEISTSQNAELLRQLESFSDQDDEMRNILDRKSQMREIRGRVDNFTRGSQNELRLSVQAVPQNKISYANLTTKQLQQHSRRPSQSSATKNE